MEYSYEVCALGYDSFDRATDTEIHLGEFSTPEAAITFAEQFETLQSVLDCAKEQYEPVYGFDPERGDKLAVRAEKVVEIEAEDELDPEEGYTECVELLYERVLEA